MIPPQKNDGLDDMIGGALEDIVSLRRLTCPVDRDAARRGLEQAYQDAGLVPAAEVIWFESPMAALEFIASAPTNRLGDYVGKIISKSWDLLSMGLGDDRIDACTIVGIMGAILKGRSPIADGPNSFDEYALHQEPFSIDALLMFGESEIARLSGLPETSQMAAISQLVQNIDGCWPFARVAIMSNRPKLMVWNADMQLHCETGPAIQFRDQKEQYYLYHTRVQEFVVRNPDAITVHSIDNEPDFRTRQVMVGRYRIGAEISGATAYFSNGGSRHLNHND